MSDETDAMDEQGNAEEATARLDYDLSQQLTSLRAVCERVLPVLDRCASDGCQHYNTIGDCGRCHQCRASIVAAELRKELGRD